MYLTSTESQASAISLTAITVPAQPRLCILSRTVRSSILQTSAEDRQGKCDDGVISIFKELRYATIRNRYEMTIPLEGTLDKNPRAPASEVTC